MSVEPEKKHDSLSDVYSRKPLRWHRGIPVFSEENEYTKNYERIAEDHLAWHRKDGTNPFIPADLWAVMERSTVGLVRKYTSPGHRILDVGVGLGGLLAHFPDRRRFGMDISFGYLENAQGKGIEVCFSLAEEMPYRENAFDLVVCTDLLEHVVDLNLCVKKMLFVTKPNGILVVRVPYRENLACYLTTPYKLVHVRNFDEYSLRLLFERIFNCEHIETSFAAYLLKEAYLRYRLPPMKLNFLVSKIITLVGLLRPELGRRLRRKLYYSLEMNVVYRKR